MNRFASIMGVLALASLTACGVKDLSAPDPGPESDVRAISATEAKECKRSGCSRQLCSETELISDCRWLPEYACYADATCERQADGACGWTQDDALTSCLAQHVDGGFVIVPPDEEEPKADCFPSGCSGQVCTDDRGLITTCEWRSEYACYQTATCERQADGACGWTEDAALLDCLAENADGGFAIVEP